MKLDGGTDGDDDGRLQAVEMSGNPPFLFRQTKCHPQYVGIRLIDHANNLGVFFRSERAEGRRIRADDPNAQVLRREALAGKRQGFVRITVKVVGESLLAGKLTERR